MPKGKAQVEERNVFAFQKTPQQMTTGEQIKQQRKRLQMTLMDLSAKTGLSAGYLSQIERDQATLTLVSLKKIAEALNFSPGVVTSADRPISGGVIRQDEQRVFRMDGSNTLYYDLSNTSDTSLSLGPLIEVLMPGDKREQLELHAHDGEEFGYVLEGVLNLYLDEKEYVLYPGDSFHFHSRIPHELANYSNRLVRVLYVLPRQSWTID